MKQTSYAETLAKNNVRLLLFSVAGLVVFLLYAYLTKGPVSGFDYEGIEAFLIIQAGALLAYAIYLWIAGSGQNNFSQTALYYLGSFGIMFLFGIAVLLFSGFIESLVIFVPIVFLAAILSIAEKFRRKS